MLLMAKTNWNMTNVKRNRYEQLLEKNLALNCEKCQFRMDKIPLMGHVLARHSTEPTKEHMKAVQ